MGEKILQSLHARPARRAPADYRQHLEIETPEHVVLDLEIAGIGIAGAGGGARHADSGRRVLSRSCSSCGILAGFGLTFGRAGALLLLLGGFVVVERLLHPVRGAARGARRPGSGSPGIRVVMDTGHAGDARRGRRAEPASARRLPSAALSHRPLLVAFHPRGKRLGDLVAGTVVTRDRPRGAGGAPRRQPALVRSRPPFPELDDEEFRLLAQFAAPPGASSRPRRGCGSAPGSPPGWSGIRPRAGPERSRPPARPARARSWPAARAASPRAGRPGAGTRFAAQKRERWDEFERLADRAARQGLDSFASHELPDFAARYREVAADLARARTYRADPATLVASRAAGGGGPQRALPGRARAPGGGSGSCWRASARRRWSQARALRAAWRSSPS